MSVHIIKVFGLKFNICKTALILKEMECLKKKKLWNLSFCKWVMCDAKIVSKGRWFEYF